MAIVFDQDSDCCVEEDGHLIFATERENEKTPSFGITVRPASFPLPSPSPTPGTIPGFGAFENRISGNSLALTASSGEGTFTSSRHGSYRDSNKSTPSLGSPLALSSVDTNLTDPFSIHGYSSQRLFCLISDALVDCAGPLGDNGTGFPEDGDRKTFLPADEVRRIICEANIRSDGEFKDLTDDIVTKIVTNWRKIFAILILVGKMTAIKGLINDGIDDRCLPFWRAKDHRTLLYRSPDDDSVKTVESIRVGTDDWSLSNLESFSVTCQWQVLVPSFDIDCPCDGYLTSQVEPHRLFPRHHIMPFIDNDNVGIGDDADGVRRFPIPSCYEVKKLYIHPAHRNRCRHPQTPTCRTTPFAVKLINGAVKENKEVALKEMDTLRRFDTTPRPKFARRIIRLLCSFEYQNTFYLIFPFADANLEQFWKEIFPSVEDLPRGPDLARWVVGEVLGLVRGLHLIHNAPTKNATHKPNGRHGDIKPQNILWFRGEKDPELAAHDETLGMLKICDFGITDFRSDVSVSRVNAYTVPRTDAYRAPECELGPEGRTSQKYDAWSLGCVLLYFVSWYAQGWDEGIDAFTDRQRSPMKTVNGTAVLYGSNFFQIVDGRFEMNSAVDEQIKMLRTHPNCNCPLFGEILDIIEKDLLRLDRDERARSDELVTRLEKIYDKCCSPVEDSDYLTPKKAIDPRPEAVEEELAVTTTAVQTVGNGVVPPKAALGVIAESVPDKMSVRLRKENWIQRILTFLRALL